MKNILILIAISLSINTFAQDINSVKNATRVTFFGVDYSNVRVFGADDTIESFRTAFVQINTLFVTETKKYNISKFLKKNTDLSFDATYKIINEAKFNEFYINSPKYNISEETIIEFVKSLPIEEKDGVGLIFIAELLDKASQKGHYQIVFFDIESREILQTKKRFGKAQGFGLRNFWAKSVFEVLKQL